MLYAIITMLVLGALLGLGLGIASKYLAVKEDERIEMVTQMLPNYNCGSCGYPGCSGLAQALVNGEVTTVGTCRPCKADQKEAIAEYLNKTPGPDGKCLKVKV
ncbi:MAG: RnfABCDGE type electron transport complex subunit B [Erysipelotrichaceae bacterium]|nr:RnfABCDGE type electron transport complex subunit B [Erysipelotrichaceae bacterium]